MEIQPYELYGFPEVMNYMGEKKGEKSGTASQICCQGTKTPL